jgi:hypothetical protein
MLFFVHPYFSARSRVLVENSLRSSRIDLTSSHVSLAAYLLPLPASDIGRAR